MKAPQEACIVNNNQLMRTKNTSDKNENQFATVKNIVLLTPYTGSNLGDAAIQNAVIDNIKVRQPSVCLRGITLRPETTAELHGINCFPLISADFTSYGKPAKKIETTSVRPAISRNYNFLTNRYIRFFLKAGLYLPRAGYRILVLLHNEVKHISSGYEFMKNTDQAVFSGGGQLDDHWGGPWHHPYTILKWAVLARIAGARVIFLSVGADHLNSVLTRFFIKRALSLAHYRSYRDEETKVRVVSLGISVNDRVYPDLAYSLPFTTQDNRRLIYDEQRRVVVGISPIGAPAWTTNGSELFETYMKNLTALVLWLISAKYTVLFFPSQTNDDPPLIEEIKSRLVTSGLRYDKDQIISEPVLDVDDLLQQIAMTDIVVASRFHSVLLANFLCKPVLALSYRSKVNNLMDDAGLQRYCIDINNVSAEDMKTLVLALLENRNVISKHLSTRVKTYIQSLDEQYDNVFGRAVNPDETGSGLTQSG
jgi:polysaccharide pyruvyl transferase WcaK-like protein